MLAFRLAPRRDAWFSVGYTGAPAADPSVLEELWQPLCWQERRMPNQPFLTESGRCTLPATLATTGDVTVGVVADPGELPFQPLPTVKNSRFGVVLRDADGRARPALFAPVLGGNGSRMAAGDSYTFRCRLLVRRGGCVAAYENLARGLFGFHDYRRNSLCSLNTTMENAITYAMGPYARFNEDLRGCAYETDVPGAVKNVSALHPLGMAILTDDPTIFARRALPMVEYDLSRERLLFTTDPKITGQGASSRLKGPCVPMSELAALYAISGRRTPLFLSLAEALYPKSRVLNLDAESPGYHWSNALSLYRATGDAAWLDRAKAGADAYLERRVACKQTDFRDPDSKGMSFWPSFVPMWPELSELYETTGEQKYVDAALAGPFGPATQFVWMCPTIPEGDVVVNPGGIAPSYRSGAKFRPVRVPEESAPAWRLSEIGLTCECAATSKGHRGILLACHGPWMLRLGALGKDAYLHDVGRSAVVGRSRTFPGYHINTARTTAYEKADFPLRDLAELNSTTSLHYNHVWPHIAMLADYLITDAETRSGGRIAFPSHYVEGYAYLQTRIYGDRPGRFYDIRDARLWMPGGLLSIDNIEVNYVAARNDDRLCLALTNQSFEPATATIVPDPVLTGAGARTRCVAAWEGDRPVAPPSFANGRFRVTVPPQGIVAVVLDGVKLEPRLQPLLEGDARPLSSRSSARLPLGNAHASLLSFGPALTSAYVYLEDRDWTSVTLRYRTGGGPWTSAEDRSFPFEFSVPLDAGAERFEFVLAGIDAGGESHESSATVLER